VAPKILSIFQGKFRDNFGPKDLIFLKSFRNIQNLDENCYFKIVRKMEISESIVYVVFQLIFLGGREIAQERGEILPKVSPFAKTLGKILEKICELKISPKPQH